MGVGGADMDKALDRVRLHTITELKQSLKNDLAEVILFGSYARGDYNDDSDVDVAVLTNSARDYLGRLTDISCDAMYNENMVLNFVCIPKTAFEQKKEWYPFYRNIWKEGVKWYGN